MKQTSSNISSLVFEPLEHRHLLAVITVESPLDNFDPTTPTSDGLVTLREAILAANADAPVGDAPAGNGADTINFSPMMSSTITLAGGRELLVTDTLTIDASSSARTIDACMASRVIFAMGDVDLTLLGVTIRFGRDTDDVGTGGSFGKGGGGIRFQSSGTLAIVNSDVVRNSTAMVEQGNGGAIHSHGEVVLVDSTLQLNSTTGRNANGGAIFSTGPISATNTQFVSNYTQGLGSGGGAIAGRVTLSDSLLVGNYTMGEGAEGGAIDGSRVTLVNSIVTQNSTRGSGSDGGGIHASSHIQVTDSVVSGNQTLSRSSDGGGMFTMFGNVEVLRSKVSDNVTSQEYSAGGGIFGFYGDVLVTDSVISGNATSGHRSRGGGIYSYSGEFRITNSTISGNSTTGANAGGGSIHSVGDVTLTNSTVSGNSTSGDGSPGGGILVTFGDLSISNSTVTDNHTTGSNSHGGGLHTNYYQVPFINPGLFVENSIVAGNSVATGSLGPDFLPDASGALVVEYSLVGDNANTGLAEAQSADADGNLIGGSIGGRIDPRLGPLSDNGGPTRTHALLPGSPTIDVGDPNFTPSPFFDQRGDTFGRIQDGDGDTVRRIDMGALETQPAISVDGDFNDDGVYDCFDIDELIAQIAAGTNAPAFDLTGDNVVNVADRDWWLGEAGEARFGIDKAYLLGDASLDGFVDGQDFIIWNAHKFMVLPPIPGWCQGNFNADAAVDGADFNIWFDHKFQSSDAQSPALSSVPSLPTSEHVRDQGETVCIPVADSNATIVPRSQPATLLRDSAFAAWSVRDTIHSGDRQERSRLNDDPEDESLINSWVF